LPVPFLKSVSRKNPWMLILSLIVKARTNDVQVSN
jgi:hypothetical protein